MKLSIQHDMYMSAELRWDRLLPIRKLGTGNSVTSWLSVSARSLNCFELVSEQLSRNLDVCTWDWQCCLAAELVT